MAFRDGNDEILFLRSRIPFDGPTLEEVLLTDIFGDVILDETEDRCNPKNATGNFSFTFELNPPYFDDRFQSREETLFLAEISHNSSTDPSQSWRVRVGKGGNIYSYVSAIGEAMPPNSKDGQYMVDEVWQTVAVDSDMNRNAHGHYFMHQAGVYQKDAPYTDEPFFFSPSLAHWCDVERRECRFASWGQHAWTPTKYVSKAIYVNRYRDCGDGVMEFTSVVHNAENLLTSDRDDYEIETTTPRYNYLSFPWFGVRDTVYRDVLIKANGAWETRFPNPTFMPPLKYDLKDTDGFSVFAEMRQNRPEFGFPGPLAEVTTAAPTFVFQDLFSRGVPCIPIAYHTMAYHTYHIMCNLANKEDNFPQRCPGCEITFTNPATNATLEVVNVVHWASGGRMYLSPKVGVFPYPIHEANYNHVTAESIASHVNELFPDGSEVVVTWTEGKSDDENHCIAFVHGVDQEIQDYSSGNRGGIAADRYWEGYSKLEYGSVYNFNRQYMAYNEVQNIYMDPGTTFSKSQYVIAGQGISAVDKIAQTYVPAVMQDYNDIGELPLTPINLFLSKDGTKFGLRLDDDVKSCRGSKMCRGYSTPQPDSKHEFTIPHFIITCGERTYFGPNLYHFAMIEKETLIRRSYICDENDLTLRPTVKLIGFFVDGDCEGFEGATLDKEYCEGEGKARERNTELEKLLLEDIFGDAVLDDDSTKCNPDTASGMFSFTHNLNPPYVSDHHIDEEKQLFLAELTHADPNTDKSWRLRIGRGGNVYSYVTALGEVMPPNLKESHFMVNDVWQTVAMDSTSGDDKFTIHQSGIRKNDSPYTDISLFYSPSIAHYCDQDGRECRFASWGQHAHVPTHYESHMIYVMRYRDCGDGVLEITSVIYNAGNNSTTPTINRISFPRFNVHASSYRELMFKSEGNFESSYPNPAIYFPKERSLNSTDGYTLFSEHRPSHSTPFSPPGFWSNPNNVPEFKFGSLPDSSQSCAPAPYLTLLHKVYHVRCQFVQKINYPAGCPGCQLTFRNIGTGAELEVVNVAQWSMAPHGYIYFAPRMGLLDDPVYENNYDDVFATRVALAATLALPDGSEFEVSWTNGKAWADNFVVGMVHGIDDTERMPQWREKETTLQYFDVFDYDRQSLVFNQIQWLSLGPGTSFAKRQYVVTGKGLTEVDAQAQEYASSVAEDFHYLGDLRDKTFELVLGSDFTTFGVRFDDKEECTGTAVCTGHSSPQVGTVPYFVISCGDKAYFGPDLYHFASVDGNIQRSYVCDETNISVRPTLKLIGWFRDGDCETFRSASYDEHYCTPTMAPTVKQSVSPIVVSTGKSSDLLNGIESRAPVLAYPVNQPYQESKVPTIVASEIIIQTIRPSVVYSSEPSIQESSVPSIEASISPTTTATINPSVEHSSSPSIQESSAPTTVASSSPTKTLTAAPYSNVPTVNWDLNNFAPEFHPSTKIQVPPLTREPTAVEMTRGPGKPINKKSDSNVKDNDKSPQKLGNFKDNTQMNKGGNGKNKKSPQLKGNDKNNNPPPPKKPGKRPGRIPRGSANNNPSTMKPGRQPRRGRNNNPSTMKPGRQPRRGRNNNPSTMKPRKPGRGKNKDKKKMKPGVKPGRNKKPGRRGNNRKEDSGREMDDDSEIDDDDEIDSEVLSN
eukprot:CAMPEP_0172489832 /NCGR_PEP_ID=MMETSP1066-20121228/20062_1 /TAXON_ID=671091 /ORGANISM="Coscinodiscus wailesii, Strain CCMP2513" /LENGTH=1635 /DNA_ID=CAMNT_0013257969 /DNA_START=104 /DNA_END=5012 /DNA_ORIENTATION=+